MNESVRTYSENALGVLRLASNKAQSSSLIYFSLKERGKRVSWLRGWLCEKKEIVET